MSGSGLRLPSRFTHSVPHKLASFRPVAQLDAVFRERPGEQFLADSPFPTYLFQGGARLVAANQKVKVRYAGANAGKLLGAVQVPAAAFGESVCYCAPVYPGLFGEFLDCGTVKMPLKQCVNVAYRDALGRTHKAVSVGGASQLDSPGTEGTLGLVPRGAVLVRHLLKRHPGKVVPDRIVSIRRFHYEGPVYDFQSPYGFIVANKLCISNCGVAATAMLLEFAGLPYDYDALRTELGTTPEAGTEPPAILAALARRGLTVTAGGDWTVDDLARLFKAGQPVLCPCQDYGTPEEERAGLSGHYVVVVGVGLGFVYVRDPSFSKLVKDTGDESSSVRAISAADWEADWHDVAADGTEYVRYGIAVGEGVPGELGGQAGVEGDGTEGDEAIPLGADGAAAAVVQAGVDPLGAGLDRGGRGPVADGAADRQVPAAAAAAARAVLADALARMFTKEANAASRAIDGKQDFEAWLSEFYGKHKATLAEALGPACLALACAGVDVFPAALADWLAGESVAVLRQAYNSDTKDQFKRRVAAWPTERAARAAEFILSGEVRPPCST